MQTVRITGKDIGLGTVDGVFVGDLPLMIEIQGDDEVIGLMIDMGVRDTIAHVQPHAGLMAYETFSDAGVRVFLGRFVEGKSLGWICYDMPGAQPTDPIVEWVKTRILTTYNIPAGAHMDKDIPWVEVKPNV